MDGNPVYLKDLAKVKDGFKDETSRSRLDGSESVNISVKKRVGENIIAIAASSSCRGGDDAPSYACGFRFVDHRRFVPTPKTNSKSKAFDSRNLSDW